VFGLVGVVLACSGFYAWWMRPAEVAAKPRPQPAVVQSVSQPVPQPISQITPPVQTATVQVTAEAQTQVINGINQVVLNLSATEKTWLSVTSEGKRLFSGFLEPSQTKTLTGVDAAQMTVGNAGGIEVRLNASQSDPLARAARSAGWYSRVRTISKCCR